MSFDGRAPLGTCPECGALGGIALLEGSRQCPDCSNVWRDGQRQGGRQ